MQTAQLDRQLTSENKTAKCKKVTSTISSAEIHTTCCLMNKLILFMIIMKKKLDLFIERILMNQVSQW